ncbi:MAG: serine/threonine-protein kinase [Phreatobacter sp.]|uniref:serine/threonine-protein kinase n=1 Tax=Phreatobacter sp. TaxID=1966341 RepID=UPI0027373D16|nr:serine/threonine-protein kinase [Phreatobacter sp.]MDP2801260.1 serine/threonine-protein kinase [Phreatobacter sp.]
MTSPAGPDALFLSFLAGKLTFDRLTAALRKDMAANPAARRDIDRVIDNLVNSGRLPSDLGALVRHAIEKEDQTADDDLDPPTEPHQRREEPHSGTVEDDPFRDKIDRVILSALVDDFRQYRDPSVGGRTGGNDARQLDDALSSFRSARVRRDAHNAASGRVRMDTHQRSQAATRAIGIGSILKDRFVLDREIGRGGMGVVYRAVDRRRLEARHAQPYVALKLLSGSFRDHPDAFRTLEAEARKVQDLAHPNIVTVHDFDRDGPNVFMVMALLEGRTLEDALNDPGSGLFDADRVIEGICRGLEQAHGRDVVHCDLKPGNVFLTLENEVKVLDFGIASAGRLSGFDAASLDALTLSYASPEMIAGEPRDVRDDVYALGCLVYRILTGRHPFDGTSASEANRLGLRPEPIEDLRGQSWGAVRAALSFARADRPANAGAFLAAYRGRSLMDRIFKR